MSTCPACGLALSASEFPYDGYYHASRECWEVYTGVLAKEYEDALLFARVHQLTVDAYAVQHAGGPHPDKSVCVHLAGLWLALERGVAPLRVPQRLQRMASRVRDWPHFEPPLERGWLTVLDVARAAGREQHVERATAWAREVWRPWSAHHAAIAAFAERFALAPAR